MKEVSCFREFSDQCWCRPEKRCASTRLLSAYIAIASAIEPPVLAERSLVEKERISADSIE